MITSVKSSKMDVVSLDSVTKNEKIQFWGYWSYFNLLRHGNYLKMKTKLLKNWPPSVKKIVHQIFLFEMYLPVGIAEIFKNFLKV